MKKISFLYIILAGIFWGTSCIFVENLAPYGLNSIHISCIRGVVSATVMALYVLFYNKSLFKATLKEYILFFASGISMFLTSATYYASMQLTSVSTAVVLMYTAPIFVMLYSVLFFGEKLTGFKTLSVIVMILGCGFVSGVIGGFRFDFWGIVLGFMAGLAYSSYNILTKIQMRNKENPLTATMYCFIFMAIVALIVSKPTEVIRVGISNPYSVILMIGCGICTSVLPYFLYTLALKRLPAGTASALGIVEPMAATIFSITIYGEKLNVLSLTGIIMILCAVFMLSRTNE